MEENRTRVSESARQGNGGGVGIGTRDVSLHGKTMDYLGPLPERRYAQTLNQQRSNAGRDDTLRTVFPFAALQCSAQTNSKVQSMSRDLTGSILLSMQRWFAAG